MRLRLSNTSASLHWCCFLAIFLATFAADLPHPKYIKRKEFKNQLSPFAFFEDSEVVIVLDGTDGVAWGSEDAGASWDKIEEATDARNVFMHPTDLKLAIITSPGKTHWITRDRGKTWKDFETPDVLSPGMSISFNAANSDHIIANVGLHPTDRSAVYTTDGFKHTPKILREGATQCMFAKERPQLNTGDDKTDETRALCVVRGREARFHLTSQRLVYSDDFFKNEVEPPVEDGRKLHGFVSMVGATRYILAARQAEGSNEMALYTSTDGNSWTRAKFGKQKIEADGFTVMEGTNYSARVDVMAGGSFGRASPMGALYSSNYNGTFFTKNEGFTNRNEFGLVDFESLDNLQGIALANIVTNSEDVLDGLPKKLQTQITFDDGRNFHSLKAGKDADQDLHLHGYSEMRNQGKVFSNKGAPGLVMGVGNTGKELRSYQDGNLWISTDGGITWPYSLEGAHKYEFGDSGSVLVAAFDEAPIDGIMYSLDFGKTWKSQPLIHPDEDKPEKMRAGLLTTILDSTSTKFLLQASTGSGDRTKYWVYSIDFALLDLAKCKKSDFEIWHAREDDKGNPGCIMGHTQSFNRRKASAECSVGDEFEEAKPESDDCDCTDEDFECAENFERSSDRKSCEPTGTLTRPRGSCTDGADKFTGSSGFQKIPGNRCKDNNLSKDKLAEVERPCGETSGKTPAADGEIVAELTTFDAQEFSDYRYLERPSTSKDDDGDETIVMAFKGHEGAWITRDHGKKWKRIEELNQQEVLGIFPNAHETNDAYFITPSKKVYYTSDRGDSFSHFEVPGLKTDAGGVPALRFHPSHNKWLIWSACADEGSSKGCKSTNAHVSTKRGLEWTPMMTDAGPCEFVWQEDRDVEEKLVYCAQKSKDGLRLLSSEDFFESEHRLFDDIVSYATMSEYIIVATRDEEDKSNLKLNSSIDAKIFAPAKFPPKMAVTHHDGYTVLDSSTNSIFLHATVESRPEREYGHIIKSNSNGTNFIKSLENVNRNSMGFADFEKLLGLKGAAVANVVANIEEVANGGSKKLKSMITHNDGADWTTIKPPKVDADGNDIKCMSERPPCSLHLHGYTERKKPDATYSSPSAVGLAIGIGNVGEFLKEKQDGDTFISTDGGVQWKIAAKGQHLWEYGDQGSIIVMVQDKSPTDTVIYSTDEGENWNEYKFTDGDLKLEVHDLTTVPSDGSRNFILWGNHVDKRQRAATVNIDFKGLFDGQCKLDEEHPDKSDYYLWQPKHPLSEGNDCLFGSVAQYHRKKLSSGKCYNGPNLDRFHDILRNCSCTIHDFEWYVSLLKSFAPLLTHRRIIERLRLLNLKPISYSDYNYERQPDGTCKLVGIQPEAELQCKANPQLTEYYDTIGYRRIPGDTCQGGQDLAAAGEAHACPGHEKDFAERHRANAAGVFFAVVGSVSAAALLGWWAWRRWSSGAGLPSLFGGSGSGFGRIRLGESGAGGVSGMPTFDADSAWVRYPVMGVSALAAGVMALPMILWSGARWGRERLGYGGGRGAYAPLGGRGGALGRDAVYSTRGSFARGRGGYAAVGANEEEGDLLGEESDDEV